MAMEITNWAMNGLGSTEQKVELSVFEDGHTDNITVVGSEQANTAYIFTHLKELVETHRLEEASKQSPEEKLTAMQKALEHVVNLTTLDDEAAKQVSVLFPEWQPGLTCLRGSRVLYLGTLYKCKQMHQAQNGLKPNAASDYWEVM